jgi:acetylornithine deacetylase/succinyl-diaminopimelate desuccinylase-like protein
MEASTIKGHLEALSVFGRPDGATFQHGVSRIGYSDADIAGRKFVMDLMPVLFGSHIDSVPDGGTAVVWACEEASFAEAMLNGSRASAESAIRLARTCCWRP